MKEVITPEKLAAFVNASPIGLMLVRMDKPALAEHMLSAWSKYLAEPGVSDFERALYERSKGDPALRDNPVSVVVLHLISITDYLEQNQPVPYYHKDLVDAIGQYIIPEYQEKFATAKFLQ